MAGDTVSVLDASDPQGDAFTFQVDDERFEVDDQGVLKLKDDMMLDHEMEASVDLVLTATDEHGHVSAETMVTVSVVDVNEAPTVNMDLPTTSTTAWPAWRWSHPVHLEDLFSDEDDTDSLFTYQLDGATEGWDLRLDGRNRDLHGYGSHR